MCTGKEIKSGLKLVQMETDVATHTSKLLLRKNTLNIVISILFICKFLRNKALSQNVGLFHHEIGLAKTSAETNMGLEGKTNLKPDNSGFLE